MSDKRRIDLSTYPRADVYKAFNDRMLPQFSTTCEVDVTALKTQLSSSAETSPTFFVALSFAVSRAVNAVPSLRHRVIDGELYEYSRVHPGYTLAREGDLFSFCDSLEHDDFATYAAHARQQMDAVRQDPDLSVGDKHQMFFITSVPWFRFTSFHHPYDPVYGYSCDTKSMQLPVYRKVRVTVTGCNHTTRGRPEPPAILKYDVSAGRRAR